MNPLSKAVGTLLVLAAGTLGTSLAPDIDLGFLPPLPAQRTGGEGADGNGTGNQTGGSGNQTAGGNSTGNQTSGGSGNQTAGNGTAGNQTGNATGNQTSTGGNATAGNETAEPEAEDAPSICEFHVDEWGGDLLAEGEEWEWRVTRDVTHLSVEFQGHGGLGLGSDSEAQLVDGLGRTVARATGGGSIHVVLERGTDYLANGLWRLTYDSDGVWDDYYVSIHVGCAG